MTTTKSLHDSETPAYGQQVMSACAFVHYDFDGVTKLFLPKRADTKKFLPGLFEMPGGHIDFGEELIPGLKREVTEEFGMSLTVGDPFGAFTYENKIKGSHTVEVIYFATFVEPLDQIQLNPEDHATYEWLSHEEVLARRKEIAADEYIDHNLGDDPEYMIMLRGFELLEKGNINFGSK